MTLASRAARAAFAVAAVAATSFGVGVVAADGAKTWSGPAGLKMAEVSTGTFKMGSPASELKFGRSGDELQHDVSIEQPFAISVTEITNAQFRQFRPEHSSGTFRGQDLDGDQQPAVMVSWEDAVAFCEWLSSQDGSRTYRLPTEAEWEWACRGEATEDPYFWGGGLKVERDADQYCNANDETAIETFKWSIPAFNRNKANDKFAATAPVGKFKANKLGLHDMAGNVWEWCEDVYGLYPVPDALGGEPVRPEPSDLTQRVIRGGAFDSPPKFCRSAARNSANEAMRAPNIGFRVVAVKGAPKAAPASPPAGEGEGDGGAADAGDGEDD